MAGGEIDLWGSLSPRAADLWGSLSPWAADLWGSLSQAADLWGSLSDEQIYVGLFRVSEVGAHAADLDAVDELFLFDTHDVHAH